MDLNEGNVPVLDVLGLCVLGFTKAISTVQTEIDIGHGLLNEIEDSMKAIQEALEYADVIKFMTKYNDHVKRYSERQERLKEMAESLRDIRIAFHANREDFSL
jgi:hypothetical protein